MYMYTCIDMYVCICIYIYVCVYIYTCISGCGTHRKLGGTCWHARCPKPSTLNQIGRSSSSDTPKSGLSNGAIRATSMNIAVPTATLPEAWAASGFGEV